MIGLSGPSQGRVTNEVKAIKVEALIFWVNFFIYSNKRDGGVKRLFYSDLGPAL